MWAALAYIPFIRSSPCLAESIKRSSSNRLGDLVPYGSRSDFSWVFSPRLLSFCPKSFFPCVVCHLNVTHFVDFVHFSVAMCCSFCGIDVDSLSFLIDILQ